MTTVQTAVLFPSKPLLDDDSTPRHGFGAKESLPITQSAL